MNQGSCRDYLKNRLKNKQKTNCHDTEQGFIYQELD